MKNGKGIKQYLFVDKNCVICAKNVKWSKRLQLIKFQEEIVKFLLGDIDAETNGVKGNQGGWQQNWILGISYQGGI